jgi:hypothetical protein
MCCHSLKLRVMRRPEMGGTAPSTRFRHTMAPIKPTQGSSLEVQVVDALGPDRRIENGELLFCFGGYNTIGEEFGANSQFVSSPTALNLLLTVRPLMHFQLGLPLISLNTTSLQCGQD